MCLSLEKEAFWTKTDLAKTILNQKGYPPTCLFFEKEAFWTEADITKTILDQK
jgi:hypothetical protein